MKIVAVEDVSHVAEARREMTAAGRTIGLSEPILGKVAIAATEIATNLLKHAGRGQMFASPYDDESGAGLQVVGLDKGPGIANVNAAMRDGHSTAGSAGQGLGAIQRQSDLFEIATWPDRGTVVLCRFQHQTAQKSGKAGASQWGAVCLPIPSEEVCGDAWHVIDRPEGIFGMVVDGLGHGPGAAAAAATAIRLASQLDYAPPSNLLDRMQAGMRATRGAAIAVFRVSESMIVYAGVGNIAGASIRTDAISRMVSTNGTLGGNAVHVKGFEYPCPPGTLVILHSDGVGTSWSLDTYPGLRVAHPALIAAVLYRDFNRGRDDSTVLVVKVGSA